MTIQELLEKAPHISVTVSLADLRQVIAEVVASVSPSQKDGTPRTLTRKETLQRLSIDPSTL